VSRRCSRPGAPVHIITLAKQDTKCSPAPDRAALIGEVAKLISDWETSDELAGEFAARLVDKFLAGFQEKGAEFHGPAS
jgi:hypothetical protein